MELENHTDGTFMNRNSILFMAAFIFTASGWALTFHIYTKEKQKLFLGDDKGEKLAILYTKTTGVERKPPNRLLWYPLEDGAELTNGDTIRTTNKGYGKIQLLESEITIGLDPGSLLVLDKKKEDVTLDVLSGSLFVKSKPKRKKKRIKSPLITAGETTISLEKNNSELSLNVEEGKSVQLDVLKGDITLDLQGKKTNFLEGQSGELTDKEIKKTKSVQVLYPLMGSVVDIGSDGNKKVSFKWKKLSANEKIFLELGSSRNNMILSTPIGVPGNTGIMNSKVPNGDFYYRIIAKSNKEITKSGIMKATAVAFSPPRLISPTLSDTNYIQRKKATISFSWSQDDYITGSKVYISRSPQFKKIIFKKSLKNATYFEHDFNKKGKYYWKVVGYVKESNKKLISKLGTFEIKPPAKLEPPKLISPEANFKIVASEINESGLFFEWEEAPSAKNYEILIRSKNKNKFKIKKLTTWNQFRLEKSEPMTLSWRVRSIGSHKQKSFWSKPRRLEILKPKEISWINPKSDVYQHTALKPSISLAWSPVKQATQWKLTYSKNDDPSHKPKTIVLKNHKNKITIDLPSDDVYKFKITAFSNKNQIIAASKSLIVNVSPPPILPPPKVLGFKDNIKYAKANGSIKVTWKNIQDAKSYNIKLKHKKSGKIRDRKSKKNSIKFKLLEPGEYSLEIASVNSIGQAGEFSESKTIKVPEVSNIKAPKAIFVH